MTGLSLSDADRLALAAAGVAEGPDGSLRSASGAIVSPGVAASLIARKDRLDGEQARPAMSTVSPDQFRRGYIAAGHASDSPANGPRGVIPEPPEGGGRSSSLCTTPDDDSGDGDSAAKVAKVLTAGDIHRGYLTAGHAAPSPGDAGDNSPVRPVTGNARQVSGHGVAEFKDGQQRVQAEHVMPSQCITAQLAPSRLSLPADLGASNVPQPRAAGATRRAPGE
jgi:hypothetical protein